MLSGHNVRKKAINAKKKHDKISSSQSVVDMFACPNWIKAR
jgi:hypothetical protein